jgi:uncharacterized surface protein with fasciclin (FAS1) repeats
MFNFPTWVCGLSSAVINSHASVERAGQRLWPSGTSIGMYPVLSQALWRIVAEGDPSEEGLRQRTLGIVLDHHGGCNQNDSFCSSKCGCKIGIRPAYWSGEAQPPHSVRQRIRHMSKSLSLMTAAFAAVALAVSPASAEKAKPETKKNIVETADAAGDFKTLIAAAKAAGLVEALTGKGPITVLAPTDEAFKKLGSTVDDLLKPENKEKLAGILKYHVIDGSVKAADVVKLDGKSAKTLNGAEIKIAVKDGKVVLNDSANVVKTDIEASNGVIHVLDAVILPSGGGSASQIGGGLTSRDLTTSGSSCGSKY